MRRAWLLVLDDLGAQSTTAWAQEKLFQLLNYRYNAKLPTIVTMSLSLEELEEAMPRLFTRMLDPNLCLHIGIIAPRFYGGRSAQPEPKQTTRRNSAKPRSRRNGVGTRG